MSTQEFPGFKRTADGPRVWTEDEVRVEFVKKVLGIAAYWAGEPGSNVPPETSTLERLEGMAHSVLATIDGCAVDLPGFRLIPDPHQDDEEFLRGEGSNWYPSDVDIAGGLHDLIGPIKRGEV